MDPTDPDPEHCITESVQFTYTYSDFPELVQFLK